MIDINGDDNLVGTQWVGFVASNEDPLFEGRCKIRVYGKFDDMSLEELPWARPATYTSGGSISGSGTFSVPKEGSIVRVTFEMGQIYAPIWHYNLYPSDELKAEIQGSYQNAHSLIYDTEAAPGPIKVFFTQEKGLMIDYNGAQVNIQPSKTIFITDDAGGTITMVGGTVTIKQSSNVIVDAGSNVNVDAGSAITVGAGTNITATAGSNIEATAGSTCFIQAGSNIGIQAGSEIRMAAGAAFNIQSPALTINASGNATIDAPSVSLGTGAAEAIMKGNTFQEIFDAHVHPTGVGPSGPPTTSAAPALSTIVRTG